VPRVAVLSLLLSLFALRVLGRLLVAEPAYAVGIHPSACKTMPYG
jgi:hypothetical protein